MDSKEHYWSIILEPNWAQVSLWTIEDDTTNIISISKPSRWEEEETLVHVVDEALSGIIEDLPSDAPDPTKTVFGVPANWVENGQIKKEYLGRIKELCGKLSLKPSGFVVLPEAIAHSLKVEDGSPLTGILVGVEEGSFAITLFKLGNLVGTVKVGRSGEAADDLIEGLARFGTMEALPSRILLYDGNEKEIEQVSQALIKADLTSGKEEKVRFLHTPKVEVISPEKKAIAVSLAGASEMGEVTKVRYKGEEKGSTPEPGLKPKESAEVETNLKEVSDLTPEDVGFAIGEEVTSHGMNNMKMEQDHVKQKRIKVPKFHLGMPGIKFPKFGRPSGGRPLIIIITLLILGIGGFLGAWWMWPKATIVVSVSPKTLEEVEDVLVVEDLEDPDFENITIPGQLATVSVDGEKTGPATGTKRVGEKASGKVEIRNGTSQAVKLSKGDTLTGTGSLQFEVNESASVSAATSPTSPGTASIEVIAADIGSEYNIAKDEVLSVSNFPKSEVDAIVVEDLSGGSSRELTAVAASDIDSLEEDLEKELLEKGKAKAMEEVGLGKLAINDTLDATVVNTSSTQKAGDEATNVSVSMEVEVSVLVIDEADLDEIAQKILESQVPSGFSLKKEQLKFDLSLVDENRGEWSFETTISANLLPSVNPDELINEIAGKNPQRAQDVLSRLPGYKGATINVSPSFPGPFGNIPRNKNNITIEIQAER